MAGAESLRHGLVVRRKVGDEGRASGSRPGLELSGGGMRSDSQGWGLIRETR